MLKEIQLLYLENKTPAVSRTQGKPKTVLDNESLRWSVVNDEATTTKIRKESQSKTAGDSRKRLSKA